MRIRAVGLYVALTIAAVLCMGPGRCGESAEGFFSGDPAPDVRGEWDVDYDDTINIEVNAGGGTYHGSVFGTAGSVTFEHDGEQVTLDLDCADPWIICPSEVFPDTITLEQRNFDSRPHQVAMTVNETHCTSDLRMPSESEGECGGDTGISCDEEICDGTVIERQSSRAGSISEPSNPREGSTPDYTLGLALGGGVAIPSANCVALAASFADAELEYSGTYDPEANNMRGTELGDGEITIVLSGACFFAGAAAGTAAAGLVAGEVRLTTGFTATRQ